MSQRSLRRGGHDLVYIYARAFNYVSIESLEIVQLRVSLQLQVYPQGTFSLRVSDLYIRYARESQGRRISSIKARITINCGFRCDFQKEQPDKQKTSASSTYNTFPDDLYLDDQDALEGSGRGGSDNRDDLEASGSGLGPDDEDGDDDHGTSLIIISKEICQS